jgi:hypothetical protein
VAKNGQVYIHSIRFLTADIHKMTNDSVRPQTTNTKPIIALDCDGVLLDYNITFAQIYEKNIWKTTNTRLT